MEEKEQRVLAFKKKIWDWICENDPEHKEYPIWLLKEFVAHWVTIPDGGRKFYFETQKKWSTGGRLATWKSNSQSWHPKKWQGELKVAFDINR